jgi:hypothetical protein
VTERYARDPDPGLIALLGELLLPWLYPAAPDAPQRCFPCIDHDHQAARSEPELEAEL